MTKILFNITHGFQARMLLRTDIAQQLLSAGCQLVVVAPNADEDYFRSEFTHPQITLIKSPGKFSRVESYLINLRQYFLMNPSLGATLNHKNETFRKHSPKFYWFARFVNMFLGRIPLLRKLYIWLEKKFFNGSEYDTVLNEQRPDLVVTGTPGYNREDIHLLRAAERLKIPTATVMLSWDNLTSKGYMGAIPDQLLVWSDLMADEAVQYHDYPREQIQWVGAAQFDHYYQARDSFDRTAWRAQHGIAADTPVIMYGTINPGIVPHEHQIVSEIVQAMRAGEFVRRPHLWIRIHPQAVKGYYRQNLDLYYQLAGPDVTIEVPPVQSEALAWDLPASDARHLAELLSVADIVTTPSSTLAIDAATVDTPIITIGFDGSPPVIVEKQVIRFSRYTHYKKILDLGGMPIAHSCQEFVQLANQYIERREHHQAERQAMLRQQLNQFDGQAGRRTAQALLKLARQT
jgi:hypothetical protein